MCIMCPSGCIYQLTPAELAHRVSRFGQTAKQHLLPVGVRRLSQLVLWKTEGETEKLETTAKDGEQWCAKELHEESSAMQLMKSLKLKFNFSARRIDEQRRQDSPLSTASTSLSMASRIIRGQMKNWAHLRGRRDRQTIIRDQIAAKEKGHRSDRNNQM